TNAIRVSVYGHSQSGLQLIDWFCLVQPNKSAEFNNVPSGELSVTAEAYPNQDCSGTVQAKATVSVTVPENGSATVTLTMTSTVDHLEVFPASGALLVNQQPLLLTVTARDAA